MIVGGWRYAMVSCDGNGCRCASMFGPVRTGDAVTAADCDEVRRRARKLGWVCEVNGGKVRDVCPVCQVNAHS